MLNRIFFILIVLLSNHISAQMFNHQKNHTEIKNSTCLPLKETYQIIDFDNVETNQYNYFNVANASKFILSMFHIVGNLNGIYLSSQRFVENNAINDPFYYRFKLEGFLHAFHLLPTFSFLWNNPLINQIAPKIDISQYKKFLVHLIESYEFCTTPFEIADGLGDVFINKNIPLQTYRKMSAAFDLFIDSSNVYESTVDLLKNGPDLDKLKKSLSQNTESTYTQISIDMMSNAIFLFSMVVASKNLLNLMNASTIQKS